MMRFLFREAARLKVPVQFHSAVGIGDYFNISDGNVFNLENVLRDPRYGDVNFVMIHGGYPYERQAVWLGAAKNVYLDCSFIGLLLYPADFKQVLRQWLLTFPEKVMFGSDAFPYNEAFGVEESYWLAAISARRALAAALAEMISANEVSEPEALKLARLFLHDNAARLYGMQTQAMK
jgi:predicted TIM-barrel fold metal-dependent hydrolase